MTILPGVFGVPQDLPLVVPLLQGMELGGLLADFLLLRSLGINGWRIILERSSKKEFQIFPYRVLNVSKLSLILILTTMSMTFLFKINFQLFPSKLRKIKFANFHF